MFKVLSFTYLPHIFSSVTCLITLRENLYDHTTEALNPKTTENNGFREGTQSKVLNVEISEYGNNLK